METKGQDQSEHYPTLLSAINAEEKRRKSEAAKVPVVPVAESEDQRISVSQQAVAERSKNNSRIGTTFSKLRDVLETSRKP